MIVPGQASPKPVARPIRVAPPGQWWARVGTPDCRVVASQTPPPAPRAPRPRPAAPGGGKPNYASDVGVTADTIRIGTINMTPATRARPRRGAGAEP